MHRARQDTYDEPTMKNQELQVLRAKTTAILDQVTDVAMYIKTDDLTQIAKARLTVTEVENKIRSLIALLAKTDH